MPLQESSSEEESEEEAVAEGALHDPSRLVNGHAGEHVRVVLTAQGVPHPGLSLPTGNISQAHELCGAPLPSPGTSGCGTACWRSERRSTGCQAGAAVNTRAVMHHGGDRNIGECAGDGRVTVAFELVQPAQLDTDSDDESDAFGTEDLRAIIADMDRAPDEADDEPTARCTTLPCAAP